MLTVQERWLEPNAEVARRVAPRQDMVRQCGDSSAVGVSSVAVDCTAACSTTGLREDLSADFQAGERSCTAEESSRGCMPSTGEDVGSSAAVPQQEPKVG